MTENIICSHRARVRQANETLRSNLQYSIQRISIIDREAFVGYFLLEDIVRLYNYRLKEECHYPSSRQNEKNFRAVIDLFNTAITLAYFAIEHGEYKIVWRSIDQKRLMTSAKSVKKMPKLMKLGVKLLRELSEISAKALDVRQERDDLDVKDFRNEYFFPTVDDIEEVIRVAEERLERMKKGCLRFPH